MPHTNYDHLYRIVDQFGVAAGLGIGVDGFVNWTAPIIGYMIGWNYGRVKEYCDKKGWSIENLTIPNCRPIGF